MEDVGQWLLYAAMIVIAFISWVFNKIQEATAARQRQKEIEEYRRKHGRDPDPVVEGDGEWETSFEEPEPAQAPTATEDAMRKLVEALGGNVVQAPPPPAPRDVPKPQPPPLPQETEAKPAPQRMSAEERAALERVQQREQREQSTPVRRRRRSSGKLGDLSVADLVRDPDGIRKAVILREILDKPRAERPWEYS